MARKRPQATHRELTADDFRHVSDRALMSSTSVGRRRVAQPPKLETIFEERKLRTLRREIDDPLENSTLRFSAAYCPTAMGKSYFAEMPFLWQQEHLENFVILSLWNGKYINVTRTLSRDKVDGMRSYALTLYREAFARGELR